MAPAWQPHLKMAKMYAKRNSRANMFCLGQRLLCDFNCTLNAKNVLSNFQPFHG